MNNSKQNKYYIKELTREQAVAIYRDIAPAHFPDDELKPVSTIEYLYDCNAYLGLGLFENTCATDTNTATSETEDTASYEYLLGYALFLTPPGLDTILLDYYAILEEYRDLGFGSIFLQGMKSHFKDIAGILIETEDPAYASNEEEALLRSRRNAFYYKNGAHSTGIACTLFGVPFQIQFMPTREVSATAEGHLADLSDTAFFRENMEATYRFMLPDEVYNRNVIWR